MVASSQSRDTRPGAPSPSPSPSSSTPTAAGSARASARGQDFAGGAATLAPRGAPPARDGGKESDALRRLRERMKADQHDEAALRAWGVELREAAAGGKVHGVVVTADDVKALQKLLHVHVGRAHRRPRAEAEEEAGSAESATKIDLFHGDQPMGYFVLKEASVGIKFKSGGDGPVGLSIASGSTLDDDHRSAAAGGGVTVSGDAGPVSAEVSASHEDLSFSMATDGEPLARAVYDNFSIEGGAVTTESGTSNGELSASVGVQAFQFKGKTIQGREVKIGMNFTLLDSEGNALVAEPSLSIGGKAWGGEYEIELGAKIAPNWEEILEEVGTAAAEGAVEDTAVAAETVETAGMAAEGGVGAAFGTVLIPVTVAYQHLRMFLKADERGRNMAIQIGNVQRRLYEDSACYAHGMLDLDRIGASPEGARAFAAGHERREDILGPARQQGNGFGVNPAEQEAIARIENHGKRGYYTERFEAVSAHYRAELVALAAQMPLTDQATRLANEAIDDLQFGYRGFEILDRGRL